MSDDMSTIVRKTVISQVRGWSLVKPDFVKVTRLTNALTNQVFRVEVPSSGSGVKDDSICDLCIRLYGSTTDGLLDRKLGTTLSRLLGNIGLGPKFICDFPEGQVEEFIKSTPVSVEETRNLDTTSELGKMLGQMHMLDLPTERIPILSSDLHLWLKCAENAVLPSKSRSKLLVKAFDLERLRYEVDWLIIKLSGLDSPVRCCHNDFHSLNLLRRTCDKKIVMLDFEYGGWNYRGYDIANHFCEMTLLNDRACFPGFCIDPDKYPDESIQKAFLHAYLAACNNKLGLEKDVTDKEVEALMEEVRPFVLASHLKWALWGLATASENEKTMNCFGYREYGMSRLWQYYALKKVITL